MLPIHPILLAAVTGFISGLLLSIPIGPINLTIINEAPRRGFRWALLIGSGATVMEVIYCFIAFTSFASFFTRGYVKATMELISFLFLLYLGIRFLAAKSVSKPIDLGARADRFEERLEEKFHPHSAFMTGLVRVMGNVGVLIFWVFLAANFISREWVTPDWPGKLACVGGVAVGTGLWFFFLSYWAGLRHGKFNEEKLLRIERISGVILLILALAHGVTIVWEMANHSMHHANELQHHEPATNLPPAQ